MNMADDESPRERLAEQLLVLRCQIRDERAFETLHEKYGAPLLYYIRRLVGDLQAAEDVFQNVWLTVHRKIATLKEPAAFRAWLYRIAHNRALQGVRRTAREVPLEEAPEVPEREADAEFGPDDAARLHEALGEVSDAQREALLLRFMSGMSYEEIAQVVGCSVGTVRSRIYYGKRVLKQKMEEKHDEQR